MKPKRVFAAAGPGTVLSPGPGPWLDPGPVRAGERIGLCPAARPEARGMAGRLSHDLVKEVFLKLYFQTDKEARSRLRLSRAGLAGPAGRRRDYERR